MITWLSAFTTDYQVAINFIAHVIVFMGTFYVALQNRKLPQWHVTPLWYLGLFSLLTALTILFQWAIGPEFPLSYWNIGRLTETLVHITVAAIAAIMLWVTLVRDLRARKHRNTTE